MPLSRRPLAFAFFFMLLLCNKGNAQTREITSQENRFTILYSLLLKSLHGSWDSTMAYSEKFSKQFTNFIRANTTTLAYPFKKLIDSNYIQIKTASDGNFRIYSWDTWTGGTMHKFNTIYQWRDNGKVFTKLPGADKDDPGSFVSQIFTVVINGKPHYLAVTNAIYSTKDARQSIGVYTINNGKLIDTVKLFKTKTKRLNQIDVDFDFFSVVDRPERPLELITYADKRKIVYIPIVGDKGQITNRNILYQLHGGNFEFIGIETGKRK